MSILENTDPTQWLHGEAYIWGCTNNWNNGVANQNAELMVAQTIAQSTIVDEDPDWGCDEWNGIMDSVAAHEGSLVFELPDGSEYELFDDAVRAQYIEDYVDMIEDEVCGQMDGMGLLSSYCKFDREMFTRDLGYSGDEESILDHYGTGLDEVTIVGRDYDTHTGGGPKVYAHLNLRRIN